MPHPRYRRPAQFLFTHHGRRLSQNAVRAELDRAAETAGLDHITPHQLRHTYATALVNAGVSLQALMALLGHMSAEMSLRYGRLFDTTVRAEYERALDLAKATGPHTRTRPAHPAADRHHRRRRLERHPAAQIPPGRRVLPARPGPGCLRLRQHLRTLPQLPRRTQLAADPRRPTRRRRSTGRRRRETRLDRRGRTTPPTHHPTRRTDQRGPNRMTSANILNRVERACAQLRQDGQPVTFTAVADRNRRRPHHPLPQPRPTRRRRPTPPPSRHQRHPHRAHRRDRHPAHRRRGHRRSGAQTRRTTPTPRPPQRLKALTGQTVESKIISRIKRRQRARGVVQRLAQARDVAGRACLARPRHVSAGGVRLGEPLQHPPPSLLLRPAAPDRLRAATRRYAAARRLIDHPVSTIRGQGPITSVICTASVTPVAADPRVSPPAPHGGSGKIGRSAQAGAAGAGSPGASGARRRQLMQHRGDLQPTGPGDPGLQVAQPFSDVGGVTDDMHVPIGVAGGDQLGQLAGARDLPVCRGRHNRASTGKHTGRDRNGSCTRSRPRPNSCRTRSVSGPSPPRRDATPPRIPSSRNA